jgi:hypothetical protein
VIDWIKTASIRDGKNIIEFRLEEQLNQPTKSIAPWLPQTFTPTL